MGNHNSGRRPQPTALKVLRGNPGKRRLNEQEPKPNGPVVKPTMTELPAAVWDRLAPIALAMGTLTAADVEAFKTLCQLQAAVDLADEGALVKIAPIIRPYYGMFGLEPTGRSKIRVTQPEAPKSKWDGLAV